jgi:primosomal protein N' (replication factor Y)
MIFVVAVVYCLQLNVAHLSIFKIFEEYESVMACCADSLSIFALLLRLKLDIGRYSGSLLFAKIWTSRLTNTQCASAMKLDEICFIGHDSFGYQRERDSRYAYLSICQKFKNEPFMTKFTDIVETFNRFYTINRIRLSNYPKKMHRKIRAIMMPHSALVCMRETYLTHGLTGVIHDSAIQSVKRSGWAMQIRQSVQRVSNSMDQDSLITLFPDESLNHYGVAVTLNLQNVYTYCSSSPLEIGQLVTVNFRNKEVIGIIVHDKFKDFSGRIKSISAILPYKMHNAYINFAKFMSNYNLISLGNVFKLLIPFNIDFILSPEKNVRSACYVKPTSVSLNNEQKEAVEILKKYSNTYKTILIHGITGSGKTEVFLEFIKQYALNAQILIMVPEVALSNELAQKISGRCASDVFIWHNSISSSKKISIWRRALNGERMVVIGARSSLFIPFKNLRTIIIDEEHDSSFKQNDSPIYNARDMAIYLGYCLNIPVILSSATPSIESYNSAISGKYEHVKLHTRYFKNACLPQVYVDDLRKKETDGILSNSSINAIAKCLSSKKQALVFVNRRGHTPRILCRSCGWKVTCPSCSTWLCFHRRTSEFVCHYCGHIANVSSECSICGEKNLVGIGAGIEKVSEECERLFPEARIFIMSSDTLGTPQKISKAIELIKNAEVDLILGTQIVAKGHNFDKLDLVIVTCADAITYADDFRSVEKSFQMMNQVAGRAGRMNGENAKVIMQTYDPNDNIIKMFKDGDIDKFYEVEIKNRKLMTVPPFGKIANITISSLSEGRAVSFANELAGSAPKNREVKMIGPLEPVLYRIRSRYRMRITLLSTASLQGYIKSWIASKKMPSDIRMSIDIDPYDFL